MKRLTLLLYIAALSASAVSQVDKLIYGNDDRVDVFESTRPDRVDLSKSTVAMIQKRKLIFDKESGSYSISKVVTLKMSKRLCENERFADQPTVSSCSGFLVSDRHLVTAGHCINSHYKCNDNVFVFDYKMKNKDEINLEFPASNVYKCKSIISHELTKRTSMDYALIELDRPVVGREPLKFRTSGEVKVATELFVIGHPSGLPTKITDGGSVMERKNNYFLANLDTYSGNSGSAVFNVETQLVEGILVRGQRDYISRDGCTESNRVANDAQDMGESVTYINRVKGLNKL